MVCTLLLIDSLHKQLWFMVDDPRRCHRINSRLAAGRSHLDDVCRRISQYLKEDKDRSQYGAQRLTTSQYTSMSVVYIICILRHHITRLT
jgi:hypothetical protein